MKIEFEFDDTLVPGDAIPLYGIAVLNILEDGVERQVTGQFGEITRLQAVALCRFGTLVADRELMEGLESGD